MRIPSLLSLLYLLIAAPSHVSTSLNASALGAEYKDVEWDDDSWSITNHNLKQADFRHRMSLSNGYLGINLAATGPFFDVDSEANGAPLNDWPLFNRRQTFATIAGFYGYRESMILPNRTNFLWLEQYGGESLISGIPHWAGLYVEADGEILNATTDPSHIHSFSTTLNITAAEMSWNYTWTPAGGDPIHVQYAMFVHKLYVNQAAVQLKLTASRDTTVKVHDVLEGDCAVRSEFAGKMFELDMPTIWSAVRPANITNVTAYVFSTVKSSQGVDLANRAELQPGVSSLGGNSSSIGQSFELNLKAGETVHVEKFIGAASTDAFHDPRAVARNASFSGAATGYDDLLSSHIKEWSTILTKDSVDSYHLANGSLPQDSNIQFLHITSVTNPFYILQNTVGPNALYEANSTGLGTHSIPVCGLGSDCYAGFIMWDADAFIAPGLQVSHPYAMQQVTRYRLEKFEQAKRNVGMAFASSQNQSKFTPGGAVYPWTSGRQGNCTGTGPCFDYEYHLNGDIAIAMHNELVVTGDDEYFKENLFPVTSAIAHFYSQLLDDRGSSGNATNGTEGRWVLRNATDPDEYVNNVDGPAFTTALIRKHLNDTNWLRERFGLPRNGTWDERVKGIHLPVDFKTGIILEYEKMNASKEIKQADVVLIDDFLHWHHPGSLKSLDYYAARQSEFGPGMTYSAFSIVANKLSPSGCSSGMWMPTCPCGRRPIPQS
jgi:trehalose/maltose hydrolase-like predicted phosphorylase